jgi:hypothetical protein
LGQGFIVRINLCRSPQTAVSRNSSYGWMSKWGQVISMANGLKRYHQEGHYHFVTFSCYRREPLLEEDRLRIVFEQTLKPRCG